MVEPPLSYNERSTLVQSSGSIGYARIATLSILGVVCLTLRSNRPDSDSDDDDNDTSFSYLRTTASDAIPFARSLQEDIGECELDCCMQFESDICPSDNEWITAIPFFLQILLIIVLIALSALFSGLTLGLMSLDKTGLEIVMGGDDPEAANYARIIYPIREDGNLLLCTLLLGNVSVNALLSILLAEYTGGVWGLLSSTFLIVIFGEIVPQALVRDPFAPRATSHW